MQWSTPRSAVIAVTAGAVALASVAVFGAVDTAGRVIASAAAVALFWFALLGGLRRPRLAVVVDSSDARLLVRGLRGVQTYRRADISRVNLTESRRLGRRTALLEIDLTDNRLLIFSRWDLGTYPGNVRETLAKHRLG